MSGNIGVAVFLILLFITRQAMIASTWPSRSYLIGVAVNLASVWILIRLIASTIQSSAVTRVVSLIAWFAVALHLLGLLDTTLGILDSVALTIGQIMRLVIFTLAVLIAMSAVGIDLSALAFFSGAIGVGLGLGLQKIVGNFISGIILLADKSIKPGDLITVGENFGRVSIMNTRYISLAAPDGREFLIPNEDLAEGDKLDLQQQQHRAQCHFRRELRLRSRTGAALGGGDRNEPAARAEIQAAGLPAHRVRRVLAGFHPAFLDRRPRRRHG